MYIFVASVFSALLAAHWFTTFGEMQFVTFDLFGEGAIALTTLRRLNPEWLVEILTDHEFVSLFVLGALAALFTAGYFWGMRLLFLEKDLPEHRIKEARKIMDENVEFSGLLERLIEQATSIDDGCKLGTINFEIRQLIWNRERMIIKQKEIENLREEITKQEKELNQI